MTARKKVADKLRERILDAMQADIGISERMAEPFVDAVMRCFAGERPYFPSSTRCYPVEDIRRALLDGTAPLAVTRKFNISRSKLHQLFPGGLPRSVTRQDKRSMG